MKEEILKCDNCRQPMFRVGGIGKNEELGEFRQQPHSEYKT